jgi:hypothetical protein
MMIKRCSCRAAVWLVCCSSSYNHKQHVQQLQLLVVAAHRAACGDVHALAGCCVCRAAGCQAAYCLCTVQHRLSFDFAVQGHMTCLLNPVRSTCVCLFQGPACSVIYAAATAASRVASMMAASNAVMC